MEKTLLLIKPDAVKAGHVGEILSILEGKKFKIESMIMFTFNRELAERFYAVHQEKEFFNDLLKFMCSGRTVALILSGRNIVSRVRHIIGSTNPEECEPDTIRGKFGTSLRMNAVRASDSVEHFFTEKEVIFG